MYKGNNREDYDSNNCKWFYDSFTPFWKAGRIDHFLPFVLNSLEKYTTRAYNRKKARNNDTSFEVVYFLLN